MRHPLHQAVVAWLYAERKARRTMAITTVGVLLFLGAIFGAIHHFEPTPEQRRAPYTVWKIQGSRADVFQLTMCDGSLYWADVRSSRVVVTDHEGRDQYQPPGFLEPAWTTQAGEAAIAAVQQYRAQNKQGEWVVPCGKYE